MSKKDANKELSRRRIYWSMRIAPREAIGTMFLGMLAISLLIALLRSQSEVRELLEIMAYGPAEGEDGLTEDELAEERFYAGRRGCRCC